MADEFEFDVFLSYSTEDKAIIRSIAEQLRVDALKVRFDDQELLHLSSSDGTASERPKSASKRLQEGACAGPGGRIGAPLIQDL